MPSDPGIGAATSVQRTRFSIARGSLWHPATLRGNLTPVYPRLPRGVSSIGITGDAEEASKVGDETLAGGAVG